MYKLMGTAVLASLIEIFTGLVLKLTVLANDQSNFSASVVSSALLQRVVAVEDLISRML